MKKLILIIISLSICFTATRTSYYSTNVYDLLDIAEKSNISIQISNRKYNIASAQTRQAWSTVFPKFTLDAGANRMESYSSKAYASFFPTFDPISNYYSASIGMSQILFNGSVFPAITASDYGLQAAQSDLNATKETVYYNVVKLYFSIIQFEEQLDVIIDSKTQLQRILDQTYELNKNGMATQIDVLRTKASLSEINATVISMTNAKETMKNNLEILLNKELESDRFDSDIITELYESQIVNNKIDMEKILNNRQDYQNLKNMVSLLKTNVDIQTGAYLPSVMLVGSYGYQGASGFNYTDANKDWMIGVNAQWNIFDFGANQTKIDEAFENYKITEKQVEQLALSIEKELDGIKLNVKSAKAKIVAIKLAEKANKDVFELVNSRFFLGDVTHLELMDAQNAVSKVRRNLVEAKIDYALEVLRWLKSTGKILSYFEKE